MASRLRDWRHENGLTQDDVAALTGYSLESISRIERGERQLTPMKKVRFARSLGVSIRELFEFEPNPEEASVS